MSHSDYQLVIFEDAGFVNLLPLVYWRDVGSLRCGSVTLGGRICRSQKRDDALLLVRDEVAGLSEGGRVVKVLPEADWTLLVNARCLLLEAIEPVGESLVARRGSEIAYIWADAALAKQLHAELFRDAAALEKTLAAVATREVDIPMVRYPWDMVHLNERALVNDWKKQDSPSQAKRVHQGAHLLAQENINIGKGSVIMPGAVLDGEQGPIMIGQNVTIKPNATLEGPLYVGDETIVQPNALVRGCCSIGPVCRVGGEVSCSIMHSFTNKQHDGFLGHSYLGQWVNLGAATTTSNLKNTYGSVRVLVNGREVDSGQMYVGLTMGDFAKAGINTTFATGAVVGFAGNIFTTAIPPRFVPSFTWITDKGSEPVRMDKSLATAETVMGRRKVKMTEAMKTRYRQISAESKTFEIET